MVLQPSAEELSPLQFETASGALPLVKIKLHARSAVGACLPPACLPHQVRVQQRQHGDTTCGVSSNLPLPTAIPPVELVLPLHSTPWNITVQVVLSFWGLNRCPIKIFYLEFPSLHPKMFFSDGSPAHSNFLDGRRESSPNKMSAGLETKHSSLVPLVPPCSPPSESGCCVEIHSQWLQYLMHCIPQNKLSNEETFEMNKQ